MKKILILLLIVVAFNQAKAQYVSLPDSAFVRMLRINYPSLIPEISRMDNAYPPGSWFRGVESKNHDLYSNLYNLMVEARDSDELIQFSIKGN